MKMFKIIPTSRPGYSLLASEEKIGNWPRYSAEIEIELAERLAESVNQHAALVAVAEIANKIECGALSARDSIAMQGALNALSAIRKEGE